MNDKDLVLVVDDKWTSDKAFDVLLPMLERSGFRYVCTSTWADEEFDPRGVDVLAEQMDEISLIIVDIIFEGQEFDGGDIIDEIRRVNSDIPIVVLTVKDDMPYSNTRRYIDKGADEFISKSEVLHNPDRVRRILLRLAGDPMNTSVRLRIRDMGREGVEISAVDRDNKDILPPMIVTYPVDQLLRDAAANPEKKTSYSRRMLMERFGIQQTYSGFRVDLSKSVYKFNQRVRKLSDNKLSVLLKGLGIYGRSAYQLVAGEVEFIRTNQD